MKPQPLQRKLGHILEQFGLKPGGDYELCHFSKANEVIFFPDAKGKRWVLKNNFKNNSAALLDTEARLAVHLRSKGCGAPEFVATTAGAPYLELEGELWTLTAFFDGQLADHRRPLADWQHSQTIRGLARFHQASRSLPDGIDTPRFKASDLERTLAWTQDLAAQLAADRSGRPSVDSMRALMPRILDLAASLPERLPASLLSGCETLMVHGDFHAFNVVFRRGRFHACFDFDFIRRDIKLFDLAYSFNDLRWQVLRAAFGKRLQEPGFSPSQAERGRLCAKALGWFLREYRREGQVGAAELALFPEMPLILLFNNLRYFSLANGEPECQGHAQWYARILDQLAGNQAALRLAVDSLNA